MHATLMTLLCVCMIRVICYGMGDGSMCAMVFVVGECVYMVC
jgi:hypothetical protein